MIYFASDFHLTPDDEINSRSREAMIVSWLKEIQRDARQLFLLGDLFDFWFEYGHVVPKGNVRLLGQIAVMSDAGIDIHLFPGNHDQWTFGYLEEELGIKVHPVPKTFHLGSKDFFLGHGDGLGPGDNGYKRIKKVFGNQGARTLFRWLHPEWGIPLARKWSRRSRMTHGEEKYLDKSSEWLFQFANTHPQREQMDYFIFGHRHLPLDLTLDNGRTRYINLGEWMNYRSYARFDGKDIELLFYQNPEARFIGQ